MGSIGVRSFQWDLQTVQQFMLPEHTVNTHRFQNIVSDFYLSQENSSLCSIAISIAFITPALALCSDQLGSQVLSVGDRIPYFYHRYFSLKLLHIIFLEVCHLSGFGTLAHVPRQ